ncbi:unnamed protein product [Gongylonema pulchrum]|uniref:Uncharacterized protein n=1 Tax=Gongylonema pulchrum TaxID=637853 RepID=A0A183E4U6_9BILA|nr:unnamed protein product [Gongylonema pulchrum]
MDIPSVCESDPVMFHSLYDESFCPRQSRNNHEPVNIQQRSVSVPRPALHPAPVGLFHLLFGKTLALSLSNELS